MTMVMLIFFQGGPDDLDELNGDLDEEVPDVEEENIDQTHDNGEEIVGHDSDGDNGEVVDNRQHNRYPKRMLTYQRKVHCIDTALDENNYTPMQIPKESKTMERIAKGNKNIPDVRYHFTNQPTKNLQGRQRRVDILHGKPGPTAKSKNTATPVDAFYMYFTNDMIDVIIKRTNEKIDTIICSASEETIKKCPFVKKITPLEVRAFIGLMLYRGLYKLNTFTVRKLFSDRYGPPIFSATMSRHRFYFLIANLTFDDETTRGDRWKKDRFTVIRDFLEMFNKQCMTCLQTCDYLSLDETLYPMRTQIAFKQYNPNKPAKYGLLFKSINAARYAYTYITAPYAGKPQEEGGKFYFPGTETITKHLVSTLHKHQPLDGRNISFDRLCTSFSLATWLLKEIHVTCIGTLMANRKGIPADLKKVDHREALSTEFYWRRRSCFGFLCGEYGYEEKEKCSDAFDSNSILGTTIDDDKNKAALYKLYDFTKGGTDIVDQRMGFYTCKVKSRKWSMVAFAYILDMARVNSSTLYALNKELCPLKQNSFEYGMDVAFDLVKPFLQQRNQARLSPVVKTKIAITLMTMKADTDHENLAANHDNQDIYPASSKKRRRCKMCINNLKTGESQNSICGVYFTCQMCGIHVCRNHSTNKCSNCNGI